MLPSCHFIKLNRWVQRLLQQYFDLFCDSAEFDWQITVFIVEITAQLFLAATILLVYVLCRDFQSYLLFRDLHLKSFYPFSDVSLLKDDKSLLSNCVYLLQYT